MNDLSALRPWLESLLCSSGEEIRYGFSDLTGVLPESLQRYPRAITLAVRMDDAIMDSIAGGPHAAYYAAYARVNALLDDLSQGIAAYIEQQGDQAKRIASATRVDFENIAGEFPHKTGAVLSGLGWIGRSSLLITHECGPRVRLGTVLTDIPLGTAPSAVIRSHCGSCMNCVTACPAKAITGTVWTPGTARACLVDAKTCDAWKLKHYPQFQGMVCGICVAVCPHGRKKRMLYPKD